MLDLSTITSCTELTSAHAKLAASSATQMRLLLERFVVIARPGEGCPKVLMALARLVDQAWVDGPLRIEIAGDDDATTLTVMSDFGAGIRERLLPVVCFAVPFDEFSRAVELSPTLALPLKITDEEGKLVLTPLLADARGRAEAPLLFEVDDTSLAEALRKTAPPPGVPCENIHEIPTRRNIQMLADKD